MVNSPCLTDKKELAIPGKMTTGKEFSNPLMAGSLPKTISAKIVDLLSTCLINYALTVSPTIYASYIEQFWNTATSKTVNSVKKIHAIVDGKAVVITNSSVRNDLLFDDEDGITCLTNDEIFENLALIGKSKSFLGKVTPLFESMLVQNQAPEGESLVTTPKPQPTPSTSQPNVSESQTELLQTETPPTVSHEPQTEANIEQILPSPSIYQRKHRKTQKHRRAKKVTELSQTSVPLDLGADEDSDNIIRTQTTAMPNVDIPQGMDTGGSPRRQETMGVLLLRLGGYTPGSDKGRLKLEELMVMCTKLSKQVLDLEKEKDAQAVEILKLKKRVKKLERQRKSSISHPRRRIYRHVESSDDELDEEDASKQGRTSDKTKPMFKDSDFDDLVDEGMAFFQEKDAENQGKIGVDDTEAVNTAGEGVSTAAPRTPPTTTTVFDDEDVTMAMAQTLIKMKEEKTKEKGVAIKDVEDSSRSIRSITTLQPLLTIDPKDKERDAEVALRLQAKLDEELRVERKRQKEAFTEGHTSGSGEGRMEHTFELMDIVTPIPHDSPLSGGYIHESDEGRLKLKELMVMCTNLSKQVLDSEKEKDAQAVEILKLKKRVKKLEIQRKSSISHPRRRIYSQKDAENQGKIGADDIKVVKGSGDTKAVNTAGERVTIAAPRTPSTTTTVFDDEDAIMAMVQTLIKMKEEKAKEKGVAIKDIEVSSRPIISITTLQPLPNIYPKDKGKGILKETEPVEKTKKKVQGDAQLERDVEVALRLQAELDEELKVERERQKEASKVAIAEMFDEVQEMIDADYELATRMTQEEQEKYTVEERARLLAEFFERRKKQLATERAEAIRNKPPIKTQQQRRIQDFTPIDSEKEAQKLGKRLKRVAGSYASQKLPKKPKVMKSVKDGTEEEAAEYEKEKEELRLSLKIISNDDSEVNYKPLSRKFPILNWEYQLLGKMEEKDMYVYKLTRANGSSSYHRDIQAFLRRLDRIDLNDLYRLVQERFQDHPLEGQDLLLWGDLRMIFDPDEKDELWMNQLDWKLLRWKLYESCGVHTLFMDGKPMEINMLVEKKYPLVKELLEKMLNLQLEAKEESTMAFELIRFIKSLLEE
ncbi:hypothetical protein Tco_0315674 [Tanacetum coccineum]